MYSIQQLQNIIIEAIDARKYPDEPAELYEPMQYMMNLGGKRLRPALLLMGCDAFGGDIYQAINPAIAIEVFHNFTLMHDDIMDNAPLRRGKTTVHEKWNSSVGILSGDAMLVEGYKLMMQVNENVLRPVLEIFNDTAIAVCEGQQIDMNFEQQPDVKINAYINMIRLKTAVVLGGALKIGALIAGARKQDADLIYAFGEDLGIAFQLQDDILDVYGDPEKFGKQVGGDIISNKKTYLLIKALETANKEQLKELNYWLQLEDFDALKKVSAVRNLFDQLEIREKSEQEMNWYAQKALQSLKDLPLDEVRKNALFEFADMLLVREN
ncbi:polyprenyl synthetase family protein [Mucilaginibacter arboris]|uniref:Polyprenyl synthetase family protein n=1 Tax=Mucilaginibacter arboris TaxID=2682090 RepID=A0A7K1SX98_9SPHI|nr:polyprenyl synthetase family protein [Mucilaginibacter arboris]MVN21923.1 polyprenyl synthetase family protein [Mucilaginibacter arboris]